jgi:hypothetical protein
MKLKARAYLIGRAGELTIERSQDFSGLQARCSNGRDQAPVRRFAGNICMSDCAEVRLRKFMQWTAALVVLSYLAGGVIVALWSISSY